MSDYTPSGAPSFNSSGTSSTIRNEFTSIQTAIASKVDKVNPTTTGTWTHNGVAMTATTTQLNYLATATSDIQTQLNTKVPTTRTVNGHALSGNVSVTASDVGLGNVTNQSKTTMFTNPVFLGDVTVSGGGPKYNASGIDFTLPGDGANNGPNCLDYFAMGSWTPSLKFNGIAATLSGAIGGYMAFGDANGVYGKMCYFSGFFNISALGAGVGIANITGLPIPAKHESAVAISITSLNPSTAGTVFQAYLPIGSTITLNVIDMTTGASTNMTNSVFNTNSNVFISGVYQI